MAIKIAGDLEFFVKILAFDTYGDVYINVKSEK